MKKFNQCLFTILISMPTCQVLAASVSPSIDLLIWHASQESSSFWASVITGPSANETIYTPPNNSFNWDPGIRIGLFSNSAYQFWDISAYWTYFSTEKNNELSLTEQLIAPEFFSGFLSKDIFFGANLNWQLIMHTIDIKMSHAINFGSSFVLSPSIGVKAGTIHQKVNARWDAVIYEATENLINQFHGIGPRFGLETKWQIQTQFCFIGNMSTALMWGKWKIQDTYQRPDALFGIITPTTITTSMTEQTLGTAIFEYFFGVEWCFRSFNNAVLQLGFETQFWTNQLRLTTFQILPLHGDLTLQGGTCRFQISF